MKLEEKFVWKVKCFALLICVFSFVYYTLGHSHFFLNGQPMKTELMMTDAFYLSVVTSSAVGFGDFVPKTRMTKMICTVQCLLVIALVVY
jgi:hypothetical protein